MRHTALWFLKVTTKSRFTHGSTF